jgi:diguanylate cyclase (GGDEF)-like protein/putative nucleotidyltransferase with HDIG domain
MRVAAAKGRLADGRLPSRMRRSLRSSADDLTPVAANEADELTRSRLRLSTAPTARASLHALAWMFLGGTTFAIGVIALAQSSHLTDGVMLPLICVAYAFGFTLLLGRRRLPAVTTDVALASGIVIVTIAISHLGNTTEQYLSILYVWSALNSAFLLSRGRAALQLALIAVSFAVYLVTTGDTPSNAAQQWLLTVGTAVVAAGLVGMLKARVERLIEEVAETAKRDPRTGLLNASGFEELLDRELERAQRADGSLSVLVVDLDHFKDVNDELGHRAADERLGLIATLLEAIKRRIDIVARVGGQEFALLLPETDEHGAYVLADRLRRAIRDHFAEDGLPTTASLGVASFPKHGSSFEELFGAAGHAVYAAKELGRDRSVIYNPEITANLRSAAMREDLQSEEHLAAVLVLAETLDMRDDGTARHSETVGRYAKQIAAELGFAPREIERVHLAGMLHDIGKIGISDTILQKPGKLSDAEWEEMRKHPELGARILDGARLDDISAWVRAHHERPDGRGYPEGLDDSRIPIQAKILAVADSYEAMTADRVYKDGMSQDAAREELLRCAGSQFDPTVVLAFIDVLQPQDRASSF